VGPFVRYSLLRLTLLAAVLGVLFLLGARGLLLVLLAVVISAALSYVLLAGPREAFVQRMIERSEARARRVDPDADAEDTADEARRRTERGGEQLPPGR
jgi:hypothetical protein